MVRQLADEARHQVRTEIHRAEAAQSRERGRALASCMYKVQPITHSGAIAEKKTFRVELPSRLAIFPGSEARCGGRKIPPSLLAFDAKQRKATTPPTSPCLPEPRRPASSTCHDSFPAPCVAIHKAKGTGRQFASGHCDGMRDATTWRGMCGLTLLSLSAVAATSPTVMDV